MKKILFCFLMLSTGFLSAEKKVLAFSGSTREDSYNQQLVMQAAGIARQQGATVTVINLRDYPMPFYNADQEAAIGMPTAAKKFRSLLLSHDAFIIATPEYNGGMPGELKNAIDWASRDFNGGFSALAFQKKKAALMSASPGKGGGKRALEELQKVIRCLGGVIVAKKVSIGEANKYFANRELPMNPDLNEEIKELLSDNF